MAELVERFAIVLNKILNMDNPPYAELREFLDAMSKAVEERHVLIQHTNALRSKIFDMEQDVQECQLAAEDEANADA